MGNILNKEQENKRLVAEFMKFLNMGDKYGNKTMFLVPKEFRFLNNNQKECSLDKLKFDTWDWMMPVVDKIRRICYEKDFVDYYKMIALFLEAVERKNTYKAVIVFINWYNEDFKN